MSEQKGFSRKELSGWGDAGAVIDRKLTVDRLPPQIDPEIREAYTHELSRVISVLLTGVHLEEYKINRTKYSATVEDNVQVEEPLSEVLMKRALKKLTVLLQ